ncbi:CapA family protein [Paenibacillus eucommiae]|uniref:Poly-gamma-glutamate synthesis protein (Capsule biosynthesis protein) n=1 Tax=Paenibacillus eucommiae TaxID=1355755 RepID=A0ABS4J9P4_9BACL|nr:CapA family protein [Paenibacillus eucommiae]MBP1996578.1 poly-gamma-glutamate synthesis protein (capsule biosynthesis protein) [Paenibacillus eucommiae]
MTEIKIAAVGDLLINRNICMSVKSPGEHLYTFDSLFEEVAPYLQEADLTIGNLEIPLKGDKPFIKKRNPKTGCPLFNCPEQLAATLKRTGFNVLTTANNHCLDNGIGGLQRTLQVLNENGLAHTGTFATREQSRKKLIVDVKGIKIGILAYTRSTNGISVPKHMPWSVNRINEDKIKKELSQIKQECDLAIVCLHFGQEHRQIPNLGQRKLVNSLLQHGADIILGSHPHVLQPILRTKSQKLAIFSLGNFISIRLNNDPYTNNGLILQLSIKKEGSSRAKLVGVDWIPTWTLRKLQNNQVSYRVLPNLQQLHTKEFNKNLTPKQLMMMEKMFTHTSTILNTSLPSGPKKG